MAVTTINLILFDDFETLDAFGPAEVLGKLPLIYRIKCHSPNGGVVLSRQGIPADTLPFSALDMSGILLIPGGKGTEQLVDEPDYIRQLKLFSEKAPYVLTVCTGSALLAKTGLLSGLKATSNKKAFEWVCSQGPDTQWIRRARWVRDGKYYTSSGVSAGIDMSLGFIGDLHGQNTAEEIARNIEYIWNRDPDDDPFCAEIY